MKVTDATLDRIQQRREKLERKGVIKEEIPRSDVAFHLWQADENGLVTRSGEHEGPGIQCVVIPSGKFIVPESKIVPAMTEEQWIIGFAHLEELPEMPMRVSPLTNAPTPPDEIIPPCDIERAPDATIGTGGEPNAHDRPLAIRPDQIDRDAAIADFEKHRKARDNPPVTSKPKPKTFQEHAARLREEMTEQFEADRLAQQKAEPRPAISMVMAPTIKEWKGY
ncbi:hypothetical protein [Rhizobium leguminosarum]|uniref:hypothetical protein n=1 Tax=Rhizobium leguminosarum TaxID=384 RepID=UPI00140F6EEB|nr:hypothetical protein [Rhizobium leguminosarum]QIO64712.1 hypothetical protein HA462_06500 [Rhizobium leguminosarum bv. trifolii]